MTFFVGLTKIIPLFFKQERKKGKENSMNRYICSTYTKFSKIKSPFFGDAERERRWRGN